eukprot:1195424-Prorocentrum_minimum.AAC.15
MSGLVPWTNPWTATGVNSPSGTVISHPHGSHSTAGKSAKANIALPGLIPHTPPNVYPIVALASAG